MLIKWLSVKIDSIDMSAMFHSSIPTSTNYSLFSWCD